MLINEPGRWTLTRLGVGKLSIPLHHEPATASVHYRLPPGAKQGRRQWYLMHLHFAITFAQGSKSGLAYVSGLTDRRAAAQVQFRLRPGEDGRRRIAWQSLDLIRGEVKQATSSRTVQVDFKNYLQLAGVRPGTNRLTFRLERFGGVRVARLQIFSDSGLILTRRRPALLKLNPMLSADDIRAGDTFELRFTVHNQGDRSARHVGVGLRPPHELRIVGGPATDLSHLPPGAAAQGVFRLKALDAGRYQMRIDASGGANLAETTVNVSVLPKDSGTRWDSVRWTAGSILLLAGVIVLAFARRRSGRA